LAVFIAKKRADRKKNRTSSGVLPFLDGEHYGVSVFGARHGLTPEQARLVDKLLSRARAERGPVRGFRYALRVGGIISAVKRGLVGNAAWGRSLLASRGGRAMALHGPHILKAISPAGARTSAIARDRRKAREAFEQDCARGVRTYERATEWPTRRRPRASWWLSRTAAACNAARSRLTRSGIWLVMRHAGQIDPVTAPRGGS
jgi:hypothetical protein